MKKPEQTAILVPRDSTIVGVHEPRELQYWARHFGVREQDVVLAVMDVGPKVDDVGYRLRERRSCEG